MEIFENSEQAIDKLRATLVGKIPEKAIQESQYYSDHDEYALSLELLLWGAHNCDFIMDDEQNSILKYLRDVIEIESHIDSEFHYYFKLFI